MPRGRPHRDAGGMSGTQEDDTEYEAWVEAALEEAELAWLSDSEESTDTSSAAPEAGQSHACDVRAEWLPADCASSLKVEAAVRWGVSRSPSKKPKLRAATAHADIFSHSFSVGRESFCTSRIARVLRECTDRRHPALCIELCDGSTHTLVFKTPACCKRFHETLIMSHPLHMPHLAGAMPPHGAPLKTRLIGGGHTIAAEGVSGPARKECIGTAQTVVSAEGEGSLAVACHAESVSAAAEGVALPQQVLQADLVGILLAPLSGPAFPAVRRRAASLQKGMSQRFAVLHCSVVEGGLALLLLASRESRFSIGAVEERHRSSNGVVVHVEASDSFLSFVGVALPPPHRGWSHYRRLRQLREELLSDAVLRCSNPAAPASVASRTVFAFGEYNTCASDAAGQGPAPQEELLQHDDLHATLQEGRFLPGFAEPTGITLPCSARVPQCPFPLRVLLRSHAAVLCRGYEGTATTVSSVHTLRVRRHRCPTLPPSVWGLRGAAGEASLPLAAEDTVQLVEVAVRPAAGLSQAAAAAAVIRPVVPWCPAAASGPWQAVHIALSELERCAVCVAAAGGEAVIPLWRSLRAAGDGVWRAEATVDSIRNSESMGLLAVEVTAYRTPPSPPPSPSPQQAEPAADTPDLLDTADTDTSTSPPPAPLRYDVRFAKQHRSAKVKAQAAEDGTASHTLSLHDTAGRAVDVWQPQGCTVLQHCTAEGAGKAPPGDSLASVSWEGVEGTALGPLWKLRGHAATVLGAGVLVSGGQVPDTAGPATVMNRSLRDTHMLTLDARGRVQRKVLPHLPVPLTGHACATLSPDCAVVYGGCSNGSTPVATVYAYSCARATWEECPLKGSRLPAREGHTLTLIEGVGCAAFGGTVLQEGGVNRSFCKDLVVISGGAWAGKGSGRAAGGRCEAVVDGGVGPAGRAGHFAFVVDGTWLVVGGGWGRGNCFHQDVFAVDLSPGALSGPVWRELRPVSRPLPVVSFAAMCPAGDNAVAVHGGTQKDGTYSNQFLVVSVCA